MSSSSPSSESLRSALREVDANLRDVQKLCSTKAQSKVHGISDEVMRFRSQIQSWHHQLERSSPTSPHVLRRRTEDAEPAPVPIPILSPPESVSPSPCVDLGAHGASVTPEFPVLTPAGLRAANEKPSLDSLSLEGSPLTPQLDSTPTTTIQLSPSHLSYLDNALTTPNEGSEAERNEDGKKKKAEKEDAEAIDDVEAKLMKSLYVVS